MSDIKEQISRYHPGVSASDPIYYGPESASIAQAEVIYDYGVSNDETADSKFGAQVTAKLSTTGFSGSIWAVLTIPAITSPNIHLPRAWGLAAIETVTVAYGSASNTYYYSGMSLLHMLVRECENRKKTEDMLTLAGKEITGVQAVGTKNIAYVLVHSAHSSMNGGDKKKKPFEIVNVDLRVTIKLRPVTTFASGAGVSSYKPDVILHLTHKTAKFLDQANSLANTKEIYSYPYFHPVSHLVSNLPIVGGNNRTSFTFNSITAGMIESILMSFHIAENQESGGLLYPLSPLETCPIYEMKIKMSGVQKYEEKGYESSLFSLTESTAGCWFDSVGLDGLQTTSPFLMKMFLGKVYNIPFTNNNLLNNPDETENVFYYGVSPPFEVSFQSSLPATTKINIHLTVLYKGIITTSGNTIKLIYS